MKMIRKIYEIDDKETRYRLYHDITDGIDNTTFTKVKNHIEKQRKEWLKAGRPKVNKDGSWKWKKNKTYEFKITLVGYGGSSSDAWKDAVKYFKLNPGETPERDEYQIVEISLG